MTALTQLLNTYRQESQTQREKGSYKNSSIFLNNQK
jgi:hypothetical protein